MTILDVITTFGIADAQSIKSIGLKLSGVILTLGAVVGATKIFMDLVSAKSKIIGNMRNGTKGAINKAREFGQSRAFYQKKEMGRNQRKAARQYSATEKYASSITYGGNNPFKAARARRMKMRAGGFDAEAQNRAYIAGLGALEKLESQETKDSAFVLKHAGIQTPAQLGVISAGGTINGVDGSKSASLRRASMLGVIESQDAEVLEQLFRGQRYKFGADGKQMKDANGNGIEEAGNVDYGMLTTEIAAHYSTTKGAGAHLVKLAPRQHAQSEIETAAAQELSALSYDKLGGQDGEAAVSALAGLKSKDPKITAYQRATLIQSAKTMLTDTKIMGGAKTKTRNAIIEMASLTPPTLPTPPTPPPAP